MKLVKCLFSESYTDENGKVTLPQRCQKMKCTGYDNEEKPFCKHFIPKDFLKEKDKEKNEIEK